MSAAYENQALFRIFRDKSPNRPLSKNKKKISLIVRLRRHKQKNRYAMRTCVCYLEIIVGHVVLSCTVQNVGFVCFVWRHVCFATLKINETVGKKKLKSLKDKVSCSQ